jgi:tetratricopeptide (TPR) repeat protein
LWQQNRFDESLALFERTVRRCPQNLLALVDASRALGARFEITKAEAMLDQLIKVGGWNPQILHLAGQSFRMIFRPEKAMDCFQRVVKAVKDIPDAQLELAVLYERRHRLDEAFALIEECLHGEPDYLEAQLFKARLLRRRKDETGSESLFQALAVNEQAHPWVRAQAWAELAQARDRQERYDDAMQAMLRCKELLRPFEGPILRESEVIQERLRGLAESCTAEHFKRWTEQQILPTNHETAHAADHDGAPLPRRVVTAEPSQTPHRMAVLTSFPRSGTTLIEQVLDAHTDLVSSDEREAFARDIFPAMWQTHQTPLPSVAILDRVPPERLAAQRQRYFAYLEAALNEPISSRLHLDKNPSLTLLLPAMLRLFPEAKVLCALRDPRDVVLSCFMQYLPLNTNSVCYLTLERTAQRYALDMGVWHRLRDVIASPWLELRYEETVSDLEKEARRAVDFLGLPWEPQVLEYRERLKEKAVSSPTYEAVSRPIYTSSIGRWKHYQKYLEPYLTTLQPLAEAFGYA